MTQPIAFFDLEATGLDLTKDRIVSIAIKRCSDLSLWVEDEFYTLVNPQIPIPKEAADIHGITDEAVVGAPTFQVVAQLIHDKLNGCILAGYNLINYDIPLLWEEFHRAGIEWEVPSQIIDVGNIFKRKEERTLSAAMRFYCGREMEGAHNAAEDVQATVDVLEGQIKRYNLTPEEIFTLSKFDNRIDLAGKLVRNEQGEAVYNFGKHKGTPVAKERGFAYWMLDKDFSEETKRQVRKVLGI